MNEIEAIISEYISKSSDGPTFTDSGMWADKPKKRRKKKAKSKRSGSRSGGGSY